MSDMDSVLELRLSMSTPLFGAAVSVAGRHRSRVHSPELEARRRLGDMAAADFRGLLIWPPISLPAPDGTGRYGPYRLQKARRPGSDGSPRTGSGSKRRPRRYGGSRESDATSLATIEQKPGHLPPATELQADEYVSAGAAQKIIDVFAETVTAQVRAQQTLVEGEIEGSKQGVFLAFVLTLIAVIAPIVFFAVGNNIAGGALLGIPVVMLARAFITRSYHGPQ